MKTMNSYAYISGVLTGDGYVDRWNTNPRIKLSVTTKEFADLFSDQIASIGLIPRRGEYDQHTKGHKTKYFSHFYSVTATCSESKLDEIQNVDTKVGSNGIDWLLGLFHSDGTLRVQHYENRDCWSWSIAKGNVGKLEKAQSVLASLGVKAKIYHSSSKRGQGCYNLKVYRRENIWKLVNLGLVKAYQSKEEMLSKLKEGSRLKFEDAPANVIRDNEKSEEALI